MKSGLTHIDVGPELTRTEWESEETHALINGTAFPGTPVERQLFYRNDEHLWYVYNGTAWEPLQSTAQIENHRQTEVHVLDQPPAAHDNTKHSVAYAAESAFNNHSARHELGGADVISVAGLSGELADDQPPKSHDNTKHSVAYAPDADLTTHEGTQAAGVHGSTNLATASKLVHRDAASRAQIANPSVDADIDNQGSRNTAIETHRTGATHALDQPPASHDNAKHSTAYTAESVFDAHSSRHALAGADELELEGLLAARQQLLTIDWQTVDQWTEVNVGGAYQTITIWRLNLVTSAASGDIAKRHTSENAIPAHDGLPCRYTFLMQNWGIAQSASVIWLGLFKNVNTPADTAIHVAFKIIDGVIYASSSDGAVQEITNTSDNGLATNAWRQKRLSFMCDTGGTIKFYIADSLAAMHTTRLPPRWSSTSRFILQMENTATVVQSVAIRAIYGAGRPLMG